MNARPQDLTIGKLADLVGVPLSTIRYYEKRELLAPKRRGKGDYRVFDTDSVARLRLILAAKATGFTLREIRSLVALSESRDCEQITPIVAAKLRDLRHKMVELEQQEARLIALAKLCEDIGDESCKFIGALGASRS